MTAVLALLSSLLWGTADFFGGTLTRRAHPFAVVGVSQTLAWLVVLPVVLLTGGLDDPRGYLPWAAAAGLTGMLALTAFYQALAIGTMGIVAPVAATGVVVPVAIGLVQGERPAALQLAGIALAVVGVVLASGPEIRGAETGSAPGGVRALALAGLAAVGFGLVLWLVAEGSQYSVGMTLLTQRTASVLFAVVVWLAARRSFGGLTGRDLPMLAVIGWLDAGANGLYALAAVSGLVSVVSVLGSLYPVVTVVLARVVHDERLRPVQNVGVALALGGVVMLAAG